MDTFFQTDFGLIFAWIGFGITCLIILLVLFTMMFFFLKWFVNLLGRKYRQLYILIEFIYYRKEFKEWVKSKERHKFMRKEK